MVPGNMDFPEIISLNVGGHIYTTSLSTLRRDPSSMIARMFSGTLPVRTDAHGNYFIDRDGTHFGTILNFLRDWDVDLPSSPQLRKQLLRECIYYQIQGLIEILGGPGELLYPPSPPSPPHSSSSAASSSHFPSNAHFMLDQASLYVIHKESLYQKHREVWHRIKDSIKVEFGMQAQGDSSTLSCSFPLQPDILTIAPFIARELQEEGLRDLVFFSNYQAGVTFVLDLPKISDGDMAEQQIMVMKLKNLSNIANPNNPGSPPRHY